MALTLPARLSREQAVNNALYQMARAIVATAAAVGGP